MGLEAVPAQVRETKERDGVTILTISGELDMASRNSIEDTVMAAVSAGGSVIIDLAELTFCDSSGIAMFIAAGTHAKAAGASLAIRNLRPPVRRVFEIIRFDTLIEVIE